MMRRFASLVLWGAFVLGGLVACDDADSNVTCDSSGDCDDGQACIGGQCQGLDTLDQDFDGDGLSNETEGQIGTDPRLVDTDGDGEDDRTEIGGAAEPLDTDGDGIIDALESDVTDSDGDGISDEQDPCNDDPTCPTLPVERCNGVDDDRDDVVDEDFALGAGCTVGIGACAREGSRVCDESGEAIRCDVNPGAPVDETCNGVDDDCDGQTDEGVLNACGGCGEVAPDVCDGEDNDCDPSTPDGSAEPWFDTDCDGEDTDLCAEGVEVCREGVRVCTDATDDARDLCNGEDDDCDPSTPDGAHEDTLGEACDGPDADRCAEGVRACTDGALVCDDASGDDLDVCDGLDNDCDPATPDGADEPWLGVACDGDDQDRCAEGQLGCVEGAQACSDATGDTPDVCDGVDNDCDPTTADGSAEAWFEAACDGADADACADGVDRCTDGRRVCDDGPEAGAERCNGEDDDCDGQTDEDFADLGQGCSVGVGACAAQGRVVCAADGAATACDAEAGAAGDEICNGLDDDCDGTVDEGDPGGGAACDTGRPGRCRDGVEMCRDGGVVCVGTEAPRDEVCDGVDDDCDGQIDETFRVGLACREGVGACAVDGLTVCTADGAGVECGAEAGAPADEVCNGLDDDCDGTVDEQASDAGGACSEGVGACAAQGQQVCVGGALRCDAAPGVPQAETCNGRDDDCDGVVDDDPVEAGARCVGGVGVCAVVGVVACVDGAPQCDAEPGAPGAEVCNGRDDDCDGTTDEEAADVGEPCVEGVGVCAAQGRLDCVAGAMVCDAEPGAPGVEVCNGLDDDCDGETDDEASDAGGACSAGEGQCARDGAEVCVGGALRCDAVAGEPVGETCNGVDDDCDGQIDDEPLDAGDPCLVGTGACTARGVRVCTDGGLACDAVAGEPAAEVCNGADDDCDGTIDEDPTDAGGDCAVGVGACLANGVLQCAGGRLACDAEPGLPRAEVCNGIDDDCDGDVDDAPQDAGQRCTVGQGECGSAGVLRCEDGGLSCDAQPGAPGPEVCDGRDNDCDGATDEEPEDEGAPCTAGIGECAAQGVTRCVAGEATCTAQPGQPAEELCNGLDDDCNGVVDDQPSDAGGDCSDGVGACVRGGVERCVGGELSCDAQAAPPGVEICNGVDDDCDGVIDNQPADAGGACAAGVGACRVAGVEICVEGGLTCGAVAGEPGVELCNGVDDDCDGVVDDQPTDVGQGCADGVGACAQQGVVRCVGGAPACDAVAGQPRPELCNGLDDDCDGVIDDQPTDAGRGCADGVGACLVRGVEQCVDGALSCDAIAGAPSLELCNGIDDDCDGVVDDDPNDAGGACADGEGACRAVGTVQCVDGALACDAVAGQGQPEVCNGIDDDCDGAVDDAPTDVGGACAVGEGACLTRGTEICLGGALTCDAAPGQPAAEVCNGIDDDCDGVIDDAAVDAGGACGVGTGACAARGTLQCVDGGLSCDAEPGAPGAEVCNGVDDDCDGQIDDDPTDAGDACSVGVGACAAQGVVVCGEGDLFCDAQPGQPGVERCNGVDDDCDGTVDEDAQDAGGACSAGVGVCLARGVEQCVDGALACDAVAGQPQPEVCNTLDDDCDGLVDNAIPGVGDACENGVGACAAGGQVVCQDGEQFCDAQPGQPGIERCNGVDDDCDGVIDDAPVDAGGACSAGVGVCLARGVEQCVDGALACDAVAGQPQPEVCNTLDDDCDGLVDNAIPGVGDACQDGTGACLADGQVVCRGGEQFCDAEAGQPVAERCNGVDDDCDGQIDEDAVDAGGACSAGVGACLANGVEQCVNGALACDAQPGQPRAEVCNAVDDDCDGSVDNAIDGVGVDCQLGAGACQADGVVVCEGGEQYCDAQPGQPSPELCNGIDDDCDGQVDDAPVDAGGVCTAGVGACFARGIEQCVNGALACDAVAGQPQPEVCNNVDDDCDGQVDDNVPGVGVVCQNGTGACQADGRVVCQGGEQFCDAQPGQPSPELCNGLDDNCDGRIDDAPTDVGGRCAAGVGICRALGTVQCAEGSPFCDAQPGQPRPEVCNNLDDDCDGTVDDNVPGVGAGCQNGLGECVADGLVVCEGGEQFCDAVPGDPGPEFCNGLDDDCDGQIDDAPVDEGANCTVGIGGCQGRGQEICVEGDLSCDAQEGQPQRERCNVVDDDCDGQTDEDFPIGDVCTVGTGACERQGAYLCVAGGLGCSAQPGQPGVEVCNGIDDDCNGEIDDALCCGAPPAQVNVAAGGDTLDLAVEVAAHPNTSDGERVGVLYLTSDPDGTVVNLRRYRTDGVAVGNEHPFGLLSNPLLNDDTHSMALVAVDGRPVQGTGRIPVFVAAWSERSDQQNAGVTLNLVRANESGTQIGGSASLPVGQEGQSVRSPALVRLTDTIIAAAWYDENAGQVRGQAYEVQYVAVGAGYFGGFVAVSNIVSLSDRLISVDNVRLAVDGDGTVVAVWDEQQELSTEIVGTTWRPLDGQADQPTRLVTAGQNGAPAEGCRAPDAAWNPITGQWMVVCQGQDVDAAEAVGLLVVADPLQVAGPVVGLSDSASRSGPPRVVSRDDGFMTLYAQTNPGATTAPVHLWSTLVFDGAADPARRWTREDDGTDSTRVAPAGVEVEGGGEVFVAFTGGVPGPPADTNTFRQRDVCLCNGEACDTGLAGRCAFGVTACDDAATCEPIQRPRQEACGNGDEDCDGQVDEGLCCQDDQLALRLNQTNSAITINNRVLEVGSTDPNGRVAPRHGAVYLVSGRIGNGVSVRVFDGFGRPYGVGAAVGNSADNVFSTSSLRQLSIEGVNAPGIAAEYQVFVAFWLERVPDSNSFGLWYVAVDASTGQLLTSGTVQDAQGLPLRDVSEPAVARVGRDHLALVYRETNAQQVQGRVLRVTSATVNGVTRIALQDIAGPRTLSGGQGFAVGPTVSSNGTDVIVAYSGQVGQAYETFTVMWPDPVGGNGSRAAIQVSGGANGPPSTCFVPDVTWHGVSGRGQRPSIVCVEPGGQGGVTGTIWWSELDAAGAPLAAEKLADVGQNPRITGGADGAQALWDQDVLDDAGALVRQPFTAWIEDGARPTAVQRLLPDPPFAARYAYDAEATFGPAGPVVAYHGGSNNDTNPDVFAAPQVCGP